MAEDRSPVVTAIYWLAIILLGLLGLFAGGCSAMFLVMGLAEDPRSIGAFAPWILIGFAVAVGAGFAIRAVRREMGRRR